MNDMQKLRDEIARSIRGFHPAETAWHELSDERKKPWLEDADRVLATVKKYLQGALEQYFRPMRFDAAHHLGLGDIRLTIGQQHDLASDLLCSRPVVNRELTTDCAHSRTVASALIPQVLTCPDCGKVLWHEETAPDSRVTDSDRQIPEQEKQ